MVNREHERCACGELFNHDALGFQDRLIDWGNITCSVMRHSVGVCLEEESGVECADCKYSRKSGCYS